MNGANIMCQVGTSALYTLFYLTNLILWGTGIISQRKKEIKKLISQGLTKIEETNQHPSGITV